MKKSEFDFSLISGESSGIWLEKGQFIGAGSKLLSLETNLMIPPSGQSNLMESIVNNTIEAFNSKGKPLALVTNKSIFCSCCYFYQSHCFYFEYFKRLF